MSLLMCFFVLLLSFSEMDVQKFKQIAGSMAFAFGVQNQLEVKDIPKGTSVIAQEFRPGKPEPTPIEVIMQRTTKVTSTSLDLQEGDSDRSGGQQDSPIEANEQSKEVVTSESEKAVSERSDESEEELEVSKGSAHAAADKVKVLAKQVAEDLREEIENGAIEIEALGQQLIIRVREKGAFPAGSAFLQPRFRPIIAKVAKIVVDIPGVVTVSGHTDNEPIQSELYRSNLDLSAQRAVSVAQEMLKIKGMRDKKLLVVGYANNKPLAEGNSPEVQRRNRRVEISIMQGEASESGEISAE